MVKVLKDGFGAITPDNATAYGEEHTTTGSGGPSRGRWLRIAAIAAAVVAVVAVLARLSTGGDDATGLDTAGPGVAQVRAAHGPNTMVNGVPSGYTRDPDGAATAAVNVIQALAQAAQGRVEMANVIATMIAKNPSSTLQKSIDVDSGRSEDSDLVFNILPAAVTVSSFTADVAQVTVWTMSMSRAPISAGDPVSVQTIWSTSELSLVWENGDWKARDKSFRSGPVPDEVVNLAKESPLAKPLQGGYYSFYVN